MKKISISLYWLKLVILLITDLICIIAIIKVSENMSSGAEEVKKIHSEQVAAKAGDQQMVLQAELDKYKDQADALAQYLPNEGNIVDSIISIDQLKKNGVISDFTFVSSSADPVRDSSGLLGFPISITITGDVNVINNGFDAISKLPFLIGPVLVNIETNQEGTLTAKYGGFIYVDPNYTSH